ncbi:hypothetical protein [Nocardia sp. NPDC004711]
MIERRVALTDQFGVQVRGHWSQGWHDQAVTEAQRHTASRYAIVSEEFLQRVDDSAPLKECDIHARPPRVEAVKSSVPQLDRRRSR